MDSYETLQNNTSNSINSKFGTSTSLKSENCNGLLLTRDEVESSRPVKYHTTSFSDLDPDNLSSLSRGINFQTGFDISPDNVNISSSLRNAIYNQKPCDGLGPTPLPTTAGFYRGHGNITVENVLARPLLERNNKTCNPSDSHYYNRTMSLFSENIPSPFANINDYFLPNSIQYGSSSRLAETKKYDRRYVSNPIPNCK
jgi:hypothetical protein